MADILRVTTPLITKNPTPLQRQPEQAELFNLLELEKVVKTNPQSELLSQNNSLIKDGGASSALIGMLKDPSYAYGFIKGIYYLQEVIGLLPLNSAAVTPELKQMFEELFVHPEDIPAELLRQESSSTVFKGELFTFIKNSFSPESSEDMILSSLRLLKELNSVIAKPDVLDSIANNLKYLSESYSPNSKLSSLLSELSESAHTVETPEEFSDFKAKVLSALKEAESSIIFSTKLGKTTSLIRYNLSRYNDNPEALRELAEQYMAHLTNDSAKTTFDVLLGNLLDSFRGAKHANYAEEGSEESEIIQTLTRLIGKQVGKEPLSPATESKLEKILYSMLSTPSNFTPLLHFITPVKFGDLHSYAEIWIDPNTNEESVGGSSSNHVHMFIVIDVDRIGQFETELFLNRNTVDVNILCPPEHTSKFLGLTSLLSGRISGSTLNFGKVTIGKLERNRSLLEVFQTLQYRRLGLDITV